MDERKVKCVGHCEEMVDSRTFNRHQKALHDQQILERNMKQCARRDVEQKTSNSEMKEPLDHPSTPDIHYASDNSFDPASQESELEKKIEEQLDAEL